MNTKRYIVIITILNHILHMILISGVIFFFLWFQIFNIATFLMFGNLLISLLFGFWINPLVYQKSKSQNILMVIFYLLLPPWLIIYYPLIRFIYKGSEIFYFWGISLIFIIFYKSMVGIVWFFATKNKFGEEKSFERI